MGKFTLFLIVCVGESSLLLQFLLFTAMALNGLKSSVYKLETLTFNWN